MSAWAWTPNAADKKRLKKSASLNRQNVKLIKNGSTQYVGRPAGPKAKGHKTPKTRLYPVMRHPVIG